MPLELINNYNGKVIIATLVEVENRVEKLKRWEWKVKNLLFCNHLLKMNVGEKDYDEQN